MSRETEARQSTAAQSADGKTAATPHRPVRHEKPQIPIATDEFLPPPRVSLSVLGLEIAELVVDDEGVRRAARAAEIAGHDLAAWAATAVVIGASALANAAPMSEMAQLRKTAEGLIGDLSSATRRTVDTLAERSQSVAEEQTAVLADQVQAQITRLATGVGRLVLADGQIPVAVRQAVHEGISPGLGEIHRLIGDLQLATTRALAEGKASSNEQLIGTIGPVLQGIDTQLGELLSEQRLRQAVGAEAKRGTAKGVQAEADLMPLVRELMDGSGVVEHLGTKTGLTGRTGDIFISAVDAPEIRVILEVKDKDGLTVDQLRRELAAARTNREAGVGIAILKRLSQSPGERVVTLLGPQDVLVVFDPADGDPDLLRVTLQVALLLSRAVRPSGGNDQKSRQLQAAASQARYLLDGLSKAESAAVTAATQAGRVRDAVTAMRGALGVLIATLSSPSTPGA